MAAVMAAAAAVAVVVTVAVAAAVVVVVVERGLDMAAFQGRGGSEFIYHPARQSKQASKQTTAANSPVSERKQRASIEHKIQIQLEDLR